MNSAPEPLLDEPALRFAAVDVGSNAVRLLLSRVFFEAEHAVFKKESLIRMPLRLGDDVFTSGEITSEKAARLAKTLSGFSELIAAYGARDRLAYATSALREAANGEEVARTVGLESGLPLEILDGQREADIICLAGADSWLNLDERYVLMDVGGGSPRSASSPTDHHVTSRSFDIGTLRVLKGRKAEDLWGELKSWVRSTTRSHRPLVAIGSGGNINKLFRLARKKEGTRLTFGELRRLHGYLEQFTYAERILRLGLSPDRADVIVPASQIYLRIMKWSRCEEMLVPLAGLADGMIQLLYQRRPRGRLRPASFRSPRPRPLCTRVMSTSSDPVSHAVPDAVSPSDEPVPQSAYEGHLDGLLARFDRYARRAFHDCADVSLHEMRVAYKMIRAALAPLPVAGPGRSRACGRTSGSTTVPRRGAAAGVPRSPAPARLAHGAGGSVDPGVDSCPDGP